MNSAQILTAQIVKAMLAFIRAGNVKMARAGEIDGTSLLDFPYTLVKETVGMYE